MRYTSVSDKEKLVSDYFRFIESLKNKGYNVVEVNNSFLLKNNPYKGINTLIKAKNGYVLELQFHTPQSLEAKETNHSLYEEFRLSKTIAKRKWELLDLMIQKSNQVEIPDFVEKIENRR